MNIKLQRLALKNFKGIREFTFEPHGQGSLIHGPNGTGKSTIADGLMWLLFGKNQAGDSSFSIKTLDGDGQEIHNLEHSVEAVLGIEQLLDRTSGPERNRRVLLRKVMTERYAQKRGSKSAPAEFTGHETVYFIDEVPKKESEFKAYVSGLVREDLFRMLTSITHFNAMKWQDCRRILLEVAGDIIDADVIDMNGDKFASLPSIMEGRSFDDTLKMLKAQRTKINDELDKLPVRIDEAKRSKPSDADCVPPEGLSYADLTARLSFLQNVRASLLAGDTSDIQAKINEKREEIDRVATEHRGNVMDAEGERIKVENRASEKKIRMAQINAELGLITKERGRLMAENDKLRPEYAELISHKKAGRTCCPTCAQDLPSDNSAAADLRKKIESNLDAKIESNKAAGTANKARIDEIGAKIDELDKERSAINTELESLRVEWEAVQLPEKPDMTKLNAEIEGLQGELSEPKGADTSAIDAEIEQVKATIRRHDEAAASNRSAAQAETRVSELKADQKRLGQEIDEIDRKIILCEGFIRAKVGMLEERVAEKFSPLSFKLFTGQINGGLSETCETLVPSPEGAMVPWSDANTGAKIIAGLKIIEVLGGHYGIHCPVFVDNAESLTILMPEMESQIIRLVAVDDGKIKGLRVVVQEESATA